MKQILSLPAIALLAIIVPTASSALGQGCPDPEFAAADFAAGDSPRAVAAGDLDNDGDLDLAIANSWTTSGIINHGTEGLHVLLNQGDGTYGAPRFHAAGVSPQSIALGDIDGDGDLDMVAAELGSFGNEWMNYGVNVLLNDGAGGFGVATLHPLDPGFVEPRSAVLGDLDHDGDLDVVVTVGYSAYQRSEIAVMLNDGGGGLAAPQYFSTGYGPFCVALGDFNGDGDLDAITANYSSNSVTRLLGDGAGGFGPPAYTYAGEDPRWVTVADLNGNETPDIAIANHDGLRVQLDAGASRFYAVGLRPTCVAAGDVDGDGDVDLVVPNSVSDNVSLLRNDGTGQFPDAALFATGDAPFGAAIADVDDSGYADIVVANMYQDTATVLLNDCAEACIADVDQDGLVGFDDVLAVLSAWGVCADCPADVDRNGLVDFDDLLIVLSAWGPCV